MLSSGWKELASLEQISEDSFFLVSGKPLFGGILLSREVNRKCSQLFPLKSKDMLPYIIPLYTGRLFHCYMSDKSICHFRGVLFFMENSASKQYRP